MTHHTPLKLRKPEALTETVAYAIVSAHQRNGNSVAAAYRVMRCYGVAPSRRRRLLRAARYLVREN